LDTVLFELLVKYSIATDDEIAIKAVWKHSFRPRKNNFYDYSKPSEHSVGKIAEKLAIPAPTVKRILSGCSKKD
jgi:hypothetical protein